MRRLETIKDRITATMYDRWSGTPDTDMEMKEAMQKAFENPCEDTIFHLAAVTESRAYREGFQDCLSMIKELFH